nr:AraC family ligand binding domain-containing protein [Planctomycetota bacterium]
MPAPLPGIDSGHELLAQLRPYLRSCGNDRRPAWHMGERCLLDYLLVFIKDGRGRATLAGAEITLEAGDLLWVPPKVRHEMWGEAPGMTCPYVHFDLLYRPSHSHWSFHIPGGATELGDLEPLCHPPLP